MNKLNEWFEMFGRSFNNMWAREERLLTQKVAIVATGGPDGSNVTVYFPPDLSTQSNNFKNKTGRTLIANEKVYVILKYGETDQGWIFD